MSKHLLASLFGGVIGACCVLIAVYVTNTKALMIPATSDMSEVVSSLHTRINDFYIFSGIVITLLLAINVGVFIRAEDEVEKHIKENFGDIEKDIRAMQDRCKEILIDMEIKNAKAKSNKSKQ